MRRGSSLVATLVIAGGLLFGAALPASAHGGGVDLTVTQDGEGGIMVTPTYQEDGHAVEDIITASVSAVADDGTKVGPMSLISSDEGEGLWVTPEPLLSDGHWKVTVTMTEPEEAKRSIQVDVAPLAGPPAATTTPDAAVGTPSPVASAAPSPLPWVLGIGGAAIIAVIAVLLVRRSRATA